MNILEEGFAVFYIEMFAKNVKIYIID